MLRFFIFMENTCHLHVISVLLLIVQLVQIMKGGISSLLDIYKIM
jgi:hypothetical protein